MRLANFQLNAIADLMEAMSGPEQEIILNRQRQDYHPDPLHGRVRKELFS